MIKLRLETNRPSLSYIHTNFELYIMISFSCAYYCKKNYHISQDKSQELSYILPCVIFSLIFLQCRQYLLLSNIVFFCFLSFIEHKNRSVLFFLYSIFLMKVFDMEKQTEIKLLLMIQYKRNYDVYLNNGLRLKSYAMYLPTLNMSFYVLMTVS